MKDKSVQSKFGKSLRKKFSNIYYTEKASDQINEGYEIAPLDERYFYKNRWLELFKEQYYSVHSTSAEPGITVVEDGVILPYQRIEGSSLGEGGVVDSKGCFIDASAIPPYFGSAYSIDAAEIKSFDETVLFIDFFKYHWGHFLIDFVCRLWYAFRVDKSIRIAYCSGQDRLDKNFKAFFDALGIDDSRLFSVKSPTRYKKIIIPDPTMGFGRPFCKEYLEVINRVVEAAEKTNAVCETTTYEKIYFTRTKLARSSNNEFGEEAIEKAFSNNGFKVLAPEELTLYEQIFYFRNCKEIASLSGTIPHNLVFARDGLHYIILNRTCVPNTPQFTIEQMRGVKCTYIDVYSKWNERHPKLYGDGPLLVGVNKNLKRYFRDNNYIIPRSDKKERAKAIYKFIRIEVHKTVGKLLSLIRK